MAAVRWFLSQSEFISTNFKLLIEGRLPQPFKFDINVIILVNTT